MPSNRKEHQTTELFFALIQCGINKRKELPRVPTADEWEELFELSTQQALPGIAYAGIEQLPKEQKPPKRLLLTWHTLSEQIKENNHDLNKKCIAVTNKFKQLGFSNSILKGQGLAQLYPTPQLRTPGDIDIWLEGGSKKILQYIKKCFPHCKPTYHHVNFPIRKGVTIEVHFTPSWTYNPFKNHKLQKFFTAVAQKQFNNTVKTPEGNFPAPTLEFNRIYILLHIFRHLFQEGIGLRQLLDYHFVLEQGFTPQEKAATTKSLKALGLYKFATAVSYVLQKTFGQTADKQIAPPNKRRGEFLLNEIMTAGNFGKYDSRYQTVSKDKEFQHFLNSMHRIARLTAQYPGETAWSPCFKAWHYLWRHHSR